MALWLNITLAWAAVALSALLVIIWALRLICKRKKIPWIQKLNRTLRKHHKVIGIFLILTALVHGLLSSESIFCLNWGTANWIVSILLGLSWLLRKKLNLKKWWMFIHRALTVAFAGLLVIHVISVGGIIIDDLIAGRIKPPSAAPEQTHVVMQEASEQETALPTLSPNGITQTEQPTVTPQDEVSIQTPQQTQTPTLAPTEALLDTALYKDGVYQGTGVGFMPGLVVEVVIEQGRIASVTVIDHNERGENFWGLPVELIPQLIVEAQSTEVDTVSGATMTSNGIMEAVNDALSNAIQ